MTENTDSDTLTDVSSSSQHFSISSKISLTEPKFCLKKSCRTHAPFLGKDVHAIENTINSHHELISQTMSNNINVNEQIETTKEGMNHGALKNMTVGDGMFDSST